MFSKFFIDRPIFATVLALLIVVAGLVTFNVLPVAQYPEITPPTVQVNAAYPGANAETVAQTVGIPIEQQVNGVEGMMYMSSTSSASGMYSLTVTFEVGTDIDMATVMVQNRVSVALNSLPEAVKQQGVTVQKKSSNIVMMLTLSGDSIYDGLYLANYANLNLVDQLTRVPGVGAVNVMGAGDYSMRIWLDPQKLAGQCAKLKCCLNYEVDAYVEASRSLPSREVELETQDGTYYFFKSDILRGEITYSTDKHIPANLVTITGRREYAVIEMNKRGERPESLLPTGGRESKQPVDLLEQENINRFDNVQRGGKKRRKGCNGNENRKPEKQH